MAYNKLSGNQLELKISLFFWSFCKSKQDMSYKDELDLASYLKATVLNLPFKVCEKWISHACDLQKQKTH